MLGLAELAARLGALSTLDRNGKLIWYDDFEAATVKWAYLASAGSTGALSTAKAWRGVNSMLLTTTADSGAYSGIRKDFPLPMDSNIGLEMMFRVGSGKPAVYLHLNGYNGTNRWQGILLFDTNAEKLYYYNDASTYIELTCNEAYVSTYEQWNFMKLTIDATTKYYKKATFNGTIYDLSAYGMTKYSSAVKPHIEIKMLNEAKTAAAAEIYIDNFILTQFEI